MNTHKQNAFTLIEVLVALAIFAILSVISTLALRRSIQTHHHLSHYDQQVTRLSIAMTLLRNDISQAIARPVREAGGHHVPAFIDKGDDSISFTRGGLLQRIRYRFTDHNLVRDTWSVLDRLPSTKSNTQVLLTGVSHPSIILYDAQNHAQRFWPTKQGSNLTDLPRGVTLTFTLAGQGTIALDIPIDSRGTPHATLPSKT